MKNIKLKKAKITHKDFALTKNGIQKDKENHIILGQIDSLDVSIKTEQQEIALIGNIEVKKKAAKTSEAIDIKSIGITKQEKDLSFTQGRNHQVKVSIFAMEYKDFTLASNLAIRFKPHKRYTKSEVLKKIHPTTIEKALKLEVLAKLKGDKYSVTCKYIDF